MQVIRRANSAHFFPPTVFHIQSIMTTSPRPPAYLRIFLLLFIINLAVYLLQIAKGVDWMKPELTDLIAWGANIAPLTMTGEPWRLFSSMFLHIGLIHLALNMYMLLICGQIVERAFGSLNFTLIYCISGLFGSLASASWYAEHKVESVNFLGQILGSHLEVVVAAGASGALMGIAGAYLARWVVLESHHQNPDPLSMHGAFAQTIGINLFMGFANTGVDNACHIGGLFSGAVVGGALALAGDGALKRGVAVVLVGAASLALLYVGVHAQPSQDLLDLKAGIQAQLRNAPLRKAEQLNKKVLAERVELDKKNLAAEIDRDAKTAARHSRYA
ncbi:membrane associated rhomboid family serine protease [Oxalobacteraceae bacterium GrIS 1.11]